MDIVGTAGVGWDFGLVPWIVVKCVFSDYYTFSILTAQQFLSDSISIHVTPSNNVSIYFD